MRLGTTVGGRYRLTRGPIHGGSGEVWLAHDGELGRDVVLKRVRGDESATGFDRLRSEARVLARFSHPHVVTLHDAVRVGKRARATSWLVMEYAPGGSLDHRPLLPAASAAHVGAQIADALIALHTAGIVHGDIKPGNVVVARDGTVKLADFGAAYRVGGNETITPNSAIGYTPEFAAPEVVRGQPQPASDVFSLAVTVYALITGAPPRPAGADGDPVPYALARGAARGGVELRADLGALDPSGGSDGLGEALTAMLRRDPADRPTAEQARELLRTAAGPVAELPPLPGPLEPERGAALLSYPPWSPSGPGPARPRVFPRGRSRTVLAVSTALAVLALAVTAWAVMRDRDGKGPEAHGAPPARPTAGASSAGASPTASHGSSLFGDRRTADPCALTKPSALSKYGDAELDIAYGNFDRCDVIVDTHAGPVDVEADLDTGPPGQSAAPVRTTGRVGVVKEPADGGECDRTLLVAGEDAAAHDGGAYVVVLAKPQDDQNPPSSLLCSMADTAAGSAVAALNAVPRGGRLARRNPPLPAASLLYRDACTLLTPQALEIVPGIDADDPDIGYGHWDCSWHSTTNDTDVELYFDRGEPPTAGEEGTPTRLGGLRAFVAPPEADDPTAEVTVVHRAYADQHGGQQAETFVVDVSGSRSAGQLRTMAVELARAAARQLAATA